MRYDRQVIGYHACRRSVAERLLFEGEAFLPSTNDWDWLGHGVYFWEFGHQRAHDWATRWPKLRSHEIAVVGAILQLGHCLDLLDTDHTRRLGAFAKAHTERFGALPLNDGVKREGDCFLVNRYCETARNDAPFDTVRGLFQEGAPVIAGSEILLESHVQVVVRRPSAIVGLFRPRGFSAWRSPRVARSRSPRHDS